MKKLLIIVLCIIAFMNATSAQTPYVRIARIVVDSTQLEAYKAILKDAMATAVGVEPGVLSMYAVQDNLHPNHITILETYASKEAYESHIQTEQFKKYKSGSMHMVQSLELTDVTPVAYEAKKE